MSGNCEIALLFKVTPDTGQITHISRLNRYRLMCPEKKMAYFTNASMCFGGFDGKVVEFDFGASFGVGETVEYLIPSRFLFECYEAACYSR